MQVENERQSFGRLFGHGWKLFSRTLGSALPGLLLCDALISVLIVAVFYYVLLAVCTPILESLQSLAMQVLTGVTDQNTAMQTLINLLAQMFSSGAQSLLMQILGGLLILLGLFPLKLCISLFLTPLAVGAAAEAQSRAWHGVRLSMRKSFENVRKSWGRLIVLGLIGCLMNAGKSAVMALIGVVPLVSALSGILEWVLSLGLSGLLFLSALIGINEDRWGFEAVGEAFSRFFSSSRPACLLLVAGGIGAAASVVTLMLDGSMALLTLFPPILTLLLSTCLKDLYLAMTVSVYYEDRVQAGYQPACRLDEQQETRI